MKTYRLVSAIVFLFLSLSIGLRPRRRDHQGFRHSEIKKHRTAQGRRSHRATRKGYGHEGRRHL